MNTRTADPFTARQCPACSQWIRCGAGQDDRQDWDHWNAEHPDEAAEYARRYPLPRGGTAYPWMTWNEHPVEVTE